MDDQQDHLNDPDATPVSAEQPTPGATESAVDPERTHRKRRRRIVGIAAAASAFVLATTGAGVATAVQLTASRSESSTATTTTPQSGSGSIGSGTTGSTPAGSGYGSGGYGSFGGTFPGSGSGSSSGNSSSGTSTSTATKATDDQEAGVVLIDTTLGYLDGSAAGTGIILSSTGEILTNNHVIEGSTKITVTIASTGTTYTADVVGTDPEDDIAVLQLENASGLTVADIDTDGVSVGDDITGVGNAEGQGYLSAADGSVTALEQQITVSDDITGASKTLDGLIEVDAGIVSGDSGGPLVDSDGEVVGIDTAASSDTSNPTGYAIPIADALSIVDEIESGSTSSDITLGLPAFLGVEFSTSSTGTSQGTAGGTTEGTSDGATIAGVLDDTPAAKAGLAAGDTITAIDGTTISSSTELSTAIAEHDPGDTVRITYTTASGATHTSSVTLIEGPAD